MNQIDFQEDIVYGRNLDIVRYVDNKRETLNPEGRAHAATVWKFYHEVKRIVLKIM